MDILTDANVRFTETSPLHYHVIDPSDGGVVSGREYARLISGSTVYANVWSRVVLEIKTTSASGIGFRPLFYHFPEGVTALVKHLKVEVKKPTRWTPSPYDLGLSYPSNIKHFTNTVNKDYIMMNEFEEGVEL